MIHSGKCQSIVFESMNDKWDLNQLQLIMLGSETLRGDEDTAESNELIMKSMNE